MAQESRLVITIDSRAAEKNADGLSDALKRVDKSGETAAASVGGATTSVEQLGKAAGKTTAPLDKTSQTLSKTGMSAAQMSNNLRMLPAQITDITVGLATGQAPFTVFLQQGGQLKDIFGGAIPALKAVGGYVAGLVNPFTVAAAAAAALGVAYYQGSSEAERFNKALITNGNAANTNANELINAAEQASRMGVTVGAAAEALTKLAATGNPVTIMYAGMAAAAVKWSSATGESIDDVVANFNKIAKDPVNAIRELDKELNILTATQYEEIRVLQDRGDKQQAAMVAEEAYASAISRRADEIKGNLGTLESAWNAITGAAKSAWDSMLNVGRQDTPEQQLASAYEALAKLNKQGQNSIVGSSADFKKQMSEVEKEITNLQLKIANNGAQSLDTAYKNTRETAAKAAMDTLRSATAESMSEMDRLQKKLKELDIAKKTATEAGAFGEKQQAEYAKARAGYEQKIADIKEREGKKNKPKSDTGALSAAESTFASLYKLADPAAAAARELTKQQEQLEFALSKGKITQEQYGEALAQASRNYSAVISKTGELTQAEQYRLQIQKQLQNQQDAANAQAATVGMGGEQAARAQERLKLEKETNDRLLQLRTELANAQGEKQRQALQAQIDITNEMFPQQIAIMENGWAQVDAAQANWMNGITAGWDNYQAKVADVAYQTETIMTDSLDTITSGYGSAFTKMALDGQSFGEVTRGVFDSLARTVLDGLGQMGAQWLVLQGIKLAFGQTEQAMHLAKMAGIATETTAEVASTSTITAAKVAADGIATASSLTATATTTTAQVAAAGTTLASWLPAALVASIGSFGAAAVVGGGALLAAFALIKGFSEGGYTGPGGVNQPAGIVHKGEVVWSQADINRSGGVAAVEAMRRGDAMPAGISASGSKSSTSAAGTSGAQVQPAAAPMTVQLVEDASKAGQVTRTQLTEGDVIRICVSNIFSEGELHDANRAKYGLSSQGT
ncbi:tail length tape measure protein [Pseudomonas sp. TMW22090]|uniref:phage tail length tape measure family protein n=1 Tax=Pseudomonas sp. TMW22090 TaxID=2506434 RepID=UPI001F0D8A6A|nr:phage tail length tape measure family protein [Pseudomonas sp. TMW22090]MCH4880168.1 tail length tape measure protein [Pseudomonas sp. TMW22090]